MIDFKNLDMSKMTAAEIMALRGKPTKYVLSLEKGIICFRVHFSSGLVSAIETVKMMNGKSFPGFRKTGAKMAKRHNVPFIDLTAGKY